MSNGKSLFGPVIYNELLSRINILTPDTRAVWGVMNVGQMMAHATKVIQNGLNENQSPRKIIGYFIAPFWRHKFYNDEPYKLKNLKTHSSFKIVERKDF